MSKQKPITRQNEEPWPEGLTIRARSVADASAVAELHNLQGYRWGTMRLPFESVEEIRRGIRAPSKSAANSAITSAKSGA